METRLEKVIRMWRGDPGASETRRVGYREEKVGNKYKFWSYQTLTRLGGYWRLQRNQRWFCNSQDRNFGKQDSPVNFLLKTCVMRDPEPPEVSCPQGDSQTVGSKSIKT